MKRMATGTIRVVLIMAMPILLMACQKVPPEFEVVSLSIVPPEVMAGETATLGAEVRNCGGDESIYDAVLTTDRVKTEVH